MKIVKVLLPLVLLAIVAAATVATQCCFGDICITKG